LSRGSTSFAKLTPPWAVGLPAQLAVVAALRDRTYYVRRYHETHALREELAADLRACGGLDVLAGTTNSVLCHLPDASRSKTAPPTAASWS